MDKKPNLLITGTRKGIGRYLAEYYVKQGFHVYGCSRKPFDGHLEHYQHFCLDVSDEKQVKQMFSEIRKDPNGLDVLINNAGIASMNHILLTPLHHAQNILNTNFIGTFLFCREAAKIMRQHRYGRIVNFGSVASPLKLAGEAVYAASKAAVVNFTQVLAKELAAFGITVNAIGPTPVETDLIRAVPQEKIYEIVNRQAIRRIGEFRDITNVIDFFIRPESDFITGQAIFLGGI
jgi:3-oxoacyl-[acyl-carrier protein] reductase